MALGGVLVIPLGIIWRMQGRNPSAIAAARNTQLSAAKARAAVMETERALGFQPVDVEFEKKGYDIESYDDVSGHHRLIEVKGRVSGADVVTVTKNEILTGLNAGDRFILALVEFLGDEGHRVHYVRRPFEDIGITHDFKGTSVNFPFEDFIRKSTRPS